MVAVGPEKTAMRGFGCFRVSAKMTSLRFADGMAVEPRLGGGIYFSSYGSCFGP